MSETFHGNDQSPQVAAAELAARQAEVGAERQSACQDLASECTDELNQSPEGRLQLVCAEEGLFLGECDPSSLLENRHLQVAFNRPLPMPPRIRERCVGILCEALDQPDLAPATALSEAVAAGQATFDNTSEEETLLETREAEIDSQIAAAETREVDVDVAIETSQTEGAELDVEIAEQAETIGAQAADIENILKTRVSAGSIAHYRTEATQIIETEYEGEAQAQAIGVLNEQLAVHTARLNAIQSVFTSQEVQQVFGGSLAQTVSLNLRGENNAQIYADVFARIDAGITDDSRRREIRSRVEAQLGITPQQQVPRNAEEMRDSLKKGYGTETKTENQTVEEPPGSGNFVEKEVVVSETTIPFSEAFPFVVSHEPYVAMFPKTPESTAYQVEGRVAGMAPVRTVVEIPSTGALPEADIHAAINKAFIAGNFRNAGLNGALEHLCGRSDATLGTSADVSAGAIGQTDMLQNVLQMFGGGLADIRTGFLSAGTLQGMTPDLRWLTVDGDFGAMNQNDPAKVQNMMTALFGASHGEIATNLSKARAVINSGTAEAPSFQALYAAIHPEDAVNGFAGLKAIVGAQGLAEMNLG